LTLVAVIHADTSLESLVMHIVMSAVGSALKELQLVPHLLLTAAMVPTWSAARL